MERLTLTRSLVAGGAATAAVAASMRAARGHGLTGLHFPRVIGTTLAADSSASRAIGSALFAVNGVLLAVGYRTVSQLTGAEATVPRGAALGLLHGLTAAGLAWALSPLHPRPAQARLLPWISGKPPAAGAAVLVGVHVLYGAILGAFARQRAVR